MAVDGTGNARSRAGSTGFAAVLGALAGAALAGEWGWTAMAIGAGAGPLLVGVLAGGIAGLLGIRPHKVVLGQLVGLAVGALGAAAGRPVRRSRRAPSSRTG